MTLLRLGLRGSPPLGARRAFTLIELMITVAMIGVLAAIGLVGYRRYVHASQGSEAKAMIQAIRGGEEAYKAEFLVYVDCSQQSFTDWYPNKSPDDSRMNWVQPTDGRYNDPNHGWNLLNVNADGPVRFGYVAVAGMGDPLLPPPDITGVSAPKMTAGVPWYSIEAKNQHNKGAGGAFAYYGSTSIDGQILVQNEQQ